MKKGQIEIIGLMMIVLLIIFVIVVVLWFAIREKPHLLEPQRENIKTISILNTLIAASYPNEDLSIQDRIEECAKNSNCNDPGVYNPTVEETLDGILKAILRDKDYYFIVKDGSGVSHIRLDENGVDLAGTGPNCDIENNLRTPEDVYIDPITNIKASLTICSQTTSRVFNTIGKW